MSSCVRYVGRVGALAFALGVGSGLAAMPMAFADNAGSDSSGSPAPASKVSAAARHPGRGNSAPSAAAKASRRNSDPVITAAPRAAAVTGSVTGQGANLLARLGSGSNGDSPAATPLMWTALAVTRRELGTTGKAAKAAAATTSGEPAAPSLAAAATVATPHANAVNAWQPGSVIGSFIAIFIGNGTAAHPNAGLLIGNGYSYTDLVDNTAIANGGTGACLNGSGGRSRATAGVAVCSSATAATASTAALAVMPVRRS